MLPVVIALAIYDVVITIICILLATFGKKGEDH